MMMMMLKLGAFKRPVFDVKYRAHCRQRGGRLKERVLAKLLLGNKKAIIRKNNKK